MRGAFSYVIGLIGLAAAWVYVDRVYAVDTPATGGPFTRAAKGCDLPAPSENAAMIFAGYYDGPAVSTVRLLAVNEQEEATTVVDIRIARGFKPIYLVVVGSRASIVRLSGWTRRLERVVLLATDRYPMGAVGIPAHRISFASSRACGILSDFLYAPERGWPIALLAGVVRRPQPAGLDAWERMRRGRYRMPDGVGGAYQPRLLTVSASGVRAQSYAAHESDPGLEEWEELAADFVPAGVAEIDPGQLVSNVRAEPYRTLPGWTGLGQMVRDGRLRHLGGNRFRVLAPIDIPAGLSGGHAVTFEMAPGVARPRGDLGHSRVR